MKPESAEKLIGHVVVQDISAFCVFAMDSWDELRNCESSVFFQYEGPPVTLLLSYISGDRSG